MKLDLTIVYLGSCMCTAVLIGWDPATPLLPTHFGLKYERGAISQPRQTTSLCNPLPAMISEDERGIQLGRHPKEARQGLFQYFTSTESSKRTAAGDVYYCILSSTKICKKIEDLFCWTPIGRDGPKLISRRHFFSHRPRAWALGYNEFYFFLENKEYRPFDGCKIEI